ncbi:Protein asteroid-like protein, partial [Stegodyphus mimosarum]
MGVRGLSSFFNQNPDLSKPCKLHDTPVIIDGNNLIHVLYFSYKVDCVYGGDYHKYASCIKKYLSSFKECNIKPIIIFDGGYDKSDRKLQTVLQRSRTRLTNTEHIAKYGRCSGKVLPIIAHEVFKDVLREMGIPFAQCDFEADDQVTALANYYKCPVISDDSDFYIFDIHHGFIRLDSVESTIITD